MRETRRNGYQYGSAARQYEEVPDYGAYKRRRQQQIERQLAEQRRMEEQQARRERAIRRNQMRELSLGKGYVTFLTVAGIITAVTAAGYVKLQSDMTAHLKSISRLESQLEDVRADNAAAQKRLSTAGDLRYIKEVAEGQFGMDYASSEQVVYYSVDNTDYMNQYADIPQ